MVSLPSANVSLVRSTLTTLYVSPGKNVYVVAPTAVKSLPEVAVPTVVVAKSTVVVNVKSLLRVMPKVAEPAPSQLLACKVVNVKDGGVWFP